MEEIQRLEKEKEETIDELRKAPFAIPYSVVCRRKIAEIQLCLDALYRELPD